MPAPSHIIRFRKQRREKLRRRPGGKLGLGFGVFFSLLILVGIASGVTAYLNLTTDLPSLETIPARLESPVGLWLQSTRIYDRTGEHVILTLQEPGAVGWRYLNLSSNGSGEEGFADSLVQATIAIVDPTYWDNPGYSWRNITNNDQRTLAQQLVNDLLLVNESPSLKRNIRERLLAGQLISRYGHVKVLEWYLNSVCYGPLIYGSDAASLAYFGKSASELSFAEAAWLVAASQTPEIKPLAAKQVVTERQRQIINQMQQEGRVTTDEAQRAMGQVLSFRPGFEEKNPHQVFINLVLEQMHQIFPTIQFERGGFQIISTLDYDLQLQASCTLDAQINWLRGTPREAMTVGETSCQAARLLPTLALVERDNFSNISGSIVVLDPDSGQVLAMVGQAQSGLDPAHLPGPPAGTLLTPFIYLSAFAHGFTPASLIWEVPESNLLGGYLPVASEMSAELVPDIEYHGPIRIRTAFANDYLQTLAQVNQRVGTENAWQIARQFGMVSVGGTSPETATLSTFLESEVTLLESVHAFSVFSNLGLQTGQNTATRDNSDDSQKLSPVAVIRVSDNDGTTLLDWSQPQSRSIVTPQLAYLVTDVLSDEAARWTSLGHPNPLEIGRPAGTQLGISLDGSQAWTVGYTPQLVVGTWLGMPDPQGQVVPKLASAALWNAVIKYASQDYPVEDWDLPAGVTHLSVCDPSGLLPTNACPLVVDEVFLAGSEPTQTDNLYQVLRINRETGQLATVFTPPELVKEQVFFVVPSWAEPWAEQAGLPVPPEGFDPIYRAQPESGDAQLTMPAMFAHVHGNVELWGSAAGSDFDYYRLQVGQGLNPTQWLLIADDGHQPVVEGKLGEWDTQGFQGLYVVQLSVIHTNQRVDSVFIQVTVDNVPPEVTIIDPSQGELFQGETLENILVQVSASDNLVLERVEFYLDDELYLTLYQPPFASMWSATPGKHLLLVRAYDLAGNSNEHSLHFEYQR